MFALKNQIVSILNFTGKKYLSSCPLSTWDTHRAQEASNFKKEICWSSRRGAVVNESD